jgi:hypothetical protein
VPMLMTAGLADSYQHLNLNGREGVVDQPDPGNLGHWMGQLRTPTGLRDEDQLSFHEHHLQVISPR